jgi:hypothetical protein
MAAHVASDDVSPVGSKSGAAEKKPPKEAVTGPSAKADISDGTKEVSAAITSEVVDMHRSDEHSVSPVSLCVVCLVNGTESLTRYPDCKVGTAEDLSPELLGKKKGKMK